MAKKKISRRSFLATGPAVAAGSAISAKGLTQESEGVHGTPPSGIPLRVQSLMSVLTKKGLIDPKAVDTLIEYYETKIGPHVGAKIVARAWLDPDFKGRLLENASAAITELGLEGIGNSRADLVAVANSSEVQNMVVCTLCSCYPWALLGLPPSWYKDTAYRSRAVIEPRGVLEEFGTTLDEDVEVHVWDSTADLRYLVIPERPQGTEGMTEEELVALVTRDSMVGVENLKPYRPEGEV
jgi:nitrile hydratase